MVFDCFSNEYRINIELIFDFTYYEYAYNYITYYGYYTNYETITKIDMFTIVLI